MIKPVALKEQIFSKIPIEVNQYCMLFQLTEVMTRRTVGQTELVRGGRGGRHDYGCILNDVVLALRGRRFQIHTTYPGDGCLKRGKRNSRGHTDSGKIGGRTSQ